MFMCIGYLTNMDYFNVLTQKIQQHWYISHAKLCPTNKVQQECDAGVEDPDKGMVLYCWV